MQVLRGAASLQVALQTFGFGLKPDTGELS